MTVILTPSALNSVEENITQSSKDSWLSSELRWMENGTPVMTFAYPLLTLAISGTHSLLSGNVSINS